MTRRRKRLIIIIVLLLILLILLTATIINYRATRKLSIPFVRVTSALITPPEYLYSFSGEADDRLVYPLGILAEEDRVFVTDSRQGRIYVFDPAGELVETFGEDEVLTPLYLARNPIDGNLYISDRRMRAVHIFQDDGTYIGEFDPNLPEEELPAFETGGVQWVPVAISFAEDGTMWVTDLLAAHRVLEFAPDGSFVRSVGTSGMSESSATNPLLFQFPNNLKIREEQVWVSDSNNRRIQIINAADGTFERLIPTEGLPRGFDFLVMASGDETPTVHLAVVDTLSHDVTLWFSGGERELTFGKRGVLEGEFSYPNDVSIGERNRIFVSDSANGRVQVWGWPEEIAPVPAIELPPYWMWCFSPLLLVPLLRLARRKRFFATEDFVEVMIEGELVDQMAYGKGRKYWMVTQPTYDRYRHLEVQAVKLEYLLHSTEHSDPDTRSIMERLEIEYETAAILSIATRARVFCTEDAKLRTLARALEVDAVDHEEYLERFGKRKDGVTAE
ncbi:MAG: hypothetical protein IBX63_07855 [Coriobacteriia bacterium]|nr:hypothetical protein [Coriobacteriia bacterium]